MSSWTGTYAITTLGTSLTSATVTTATNTGASWPTGAQSLANFRIRFTSGVNNGRDVVIVSNTATVITVSSWPVGTPSAGDTYILVLQFQNGDHITANTVISTNVQVEIAANAQLNVDGNFNLTFQTSGKVAMGMSISTMPTICYNNRTVQGSRGAWADIVFASTLTVAPLFSYIRIQDCAAPTLFQPSTGLAGALGVHHLWCEAMNSESIAVSGALTQNMTFANILHRNGGGAQIVMSVTNSTFSEIYDTCWFQETTQGGVSWGGAVGSALEWVTNCVFINSQRYGEADAYSTQEKRASRNYVTGTSYAVGAAPWLLGQSGSANAGKIIAFGNVSRAGAIINCAGAASLQAGSIHSIANDVAARGVGARGLNCPANSATTITSDFDYFAGSNGASSENVDTTASTTSTATPGQYSILTSARTNPCSTPNQPLTVNNVVVGTPSANACAITFDCANGVQAGQQTTVNGTSASGQATLAVASTAFFYVGMVVEVGYGTARAEAPLRIASISAGVSLTFETNLAFSHTAVQADVVAMQLRNTGLPFVRYGTASGVYTMQTEVPDPLDWGLFYTGLRTSSFGQTYVFNRTGHSVTLANLKPGTTYYARCFAYTPLGDLVDQGAESTFTTPAVTTAVAFAA